MRALEDLFTPYAEKMSEIVRQQQNPLGGLDFKLH